MKVRTRIAPTPSGRLHIGNLANFLLIEKLVQASNGTLILRIDDCDGTRARREFVEHIFSVLAWLDVMWQEGPRSAEDFYQNFSQVKRKDYYFQHLKALTSHVYACACSRQVASPGCCRNKGLSFVSGEHALRLRVDDATLFSQFGDVVLWRKDDGPAYHLASVIDDLDHRTNLIVRGEDLRASSALQFYIAELLSPGGFSGVHFIHHPLLLDEDGEKLSKSKESQSVVALMKSGLSRDELRSRLAAVIDGWEMKGSPMTIP